MSKFDGNIRTSKVLSDDELRASLKGGWDKELPAIEDEHGVLLVGHRRMKIAQEEGIEPVVKVVTFGTGTEAEAARIRLANVSNVGAAPMTAEDRRRQAEHLYESGLTMEQIGHVLGVSQPTISNDLRGLLTTNKPLRPKGGRPKSSGKRASKRGNETPKLDQAREIVREKLDANEPINPHKLQKKHDISHVTFDMAITAEIARKEALAEKAALDPSHLSKTAQEKLEAAIRAYQRKLDANFHASVLEEVRKRIDEMILPHWQQKIDQAQELYKRRRGAMDKETFNTIRRALHPDSRQSISDKKLGEAFDTFMSLEKFLLDEKASPTDLSGLPRTWQEWEDAKRKTSEERRAKRQAGKSALRRA